MLKIVSLKPRCSSNCCRQRRKSTAAERGECSNMRAASVYVSLQVGGKSGLAGGRFAGDS